MNVDTVMTSAALINVRSKSNIQASLLIILRILRDDIIVIFVRVRVTRSVSQSVSQSVSLSWCRAPSRAHDQMFITV
jgi:hypothetical protein